MSETPDTPPQSTPNTVSEEMVEAGRKVLFRYMSEAGVHALDPDKDWKVFIYEDAARDILQAARPHDPLVAENERLRGLLDEWLSVVLPAEEHDKILRDHDGLQQRTVRAVDGAALTAACGCQGERLCSYHEGVADGSETAAAEIEHLNVQLNRTCGELVRHNNCREEMARLRHAASEIAEHASVMPMPTGGDSSYWLMVPMTKVEQLRAALTREEGR